MVRFEIQYNHQSSGVPLTGSITLAKTEKNGFVTINVTEFGIDKTSMRFYPANGYDTILPVDERTFSEIKNNLRTAYEMVNFNTTHYIWIDTEVDRPCRNLNLVELGRLELNLTRPRS